MAYVFVYSMAFLGVTGVMYFLNNNFENIFDFNFKPYNPQRVVIRVKEPKPVFNPKLEDYTKKVLSNIKEEIIDSLEKFNHGLQPDTVYKEVVVQDQNLIDSLNNSLRKLEKEKQDAEKSIAEKNKELEKLKLVKEETKAEDGQNYQDWISSTVKLYESMDSKSAAKIITNYSDNVARDIIYAMKKKKAAEILSNLSSEQIVKLTQAK